MTAAAPDFPMPPFVSNDEAKLLLAIKLYETSRLTLGQAAEMAGYSKRGFMDILSHHGIAVVDYPASELTQETAW